MNRPWSSGLLSIALKCSQEFFFDCFLLFCNVSSVSRLLCVYAARLCVCVFVLLLVCVFVCVGRCWPLCTNQHCRLHLSVCYASLRVLPYVNVFCWTFVELLLREMEYCWVCYFHLSTDARRVALTLCLFYDQRQRETSWHDHCRVSLLAALSMMCYNYAR